MAKAIEGCDGEHLLLCDNLAGQDVRKTAGEDGKKTKAVAESIGVRIWNLLAGATDEVQVIDAGIGAILKRIMHQLTDNWLNTEEALDWYAILRLPYWLDVH
jgi:hypothetical protein